MNKKDNEKYSNFFYFCTVYGGLEDAVDHGEVKDKEACTGTVVAGPQTAVEHRNLSYLRLQKESAKKKGGGKQCEENWIKKINNEAKIRADAEPGSRGLGPWFPHGPWFSPRATK